MKINERYLWIAGIILAGFAMQNQFNNNNNLRTLLQSYEVETNIQNAQINDFSSQLSVVKAESYSEGFEAGKTQAGVALARGGSLYDYTDGYHAAIGQNIEEEDVLEISAGIMTELTSLRKMVPRLMNQVETLLQPTNNSDYALELLMEYLETEENIDLTYLEIIDMFIEEARTPSIPRLPTKDIVEVGQQGPVGEKGASLGDVHEVSVAIKSEEALIDSFYMRLVQKKVTRFPEAGSSLLMGKGVRGFAKWFEKRTNFLSSEIWYNNYCVAVPSAKSPHKSLKNFQGKGVFPILWTKGLQADGTWKSNSPWGGKGGHILFNDGRVEWREKTLLNLESSIPPHWKVLRPRK